MDEVDRRVVLRRRTPVIFVCSAVAVDARGEPTVTGGGRGRLAASVSVTPAIASVTTFEPLVCAVPSTVNAASCARPASRAKVRPEVPSVVIDEIEAAVPVAAVGEHELPADDRGVDRRVADALDLRGDRRPASRPRRWPRPWSCPPTVRWRTSSAAAVVAPEAVNWFARASCEIEIA